MKKRVIALLGVMLLSVLTTVSAMTAVQQQEVRAAWEAAYKVKVDGPAAISLLNQAQLTLPAHFVYIPEPQANRLMEAMGNTKSDELIGLVMSDKDEDNWYVIIEYDKSGYIKDDDAKKWDVDELYKSVQEGTEEANKEYRQKGLAEVELIGWVEKPQYEAAHHQLIWSMNSKDKGSTEPASQNTINYNTYVLGRQGYLSLNLVTDMGHVEAQKPIIKTLLDNTHFVSGKRYEDFNSVTDKVAEYGLAALVGGVAVKKAGLLAGVMVFLAKFAKIIILAVGGGAVAIAKFFGFKKGNDDKNDPA